MADIDRLGGTPDSSAALVARLSGIRTDVSVKRSVVVATAANITLLGLQTIDDVVLTEGDRVLVAAQTAGAENGVYAASSGAWSRVLDFNGSYDVAKGTMIFVTGGTATGDRLYYITNADPITIGTTVLTFNYILSTTAITVADIFPAGMIVMWSGAISAVPLGWVLCDGTNGTPNLSGKFVIHADADAGGTYNVGDIGGAATVALAEGELPVHTHGFGTLSTASDGGHTPAGTTSSELNHTHSIRLIGGDAGAGAGGLIGAIGNNSITTGSATPNSVAAHTHTLTMDAVADHTHALSGATGSTGSGTAHENLPPYYALAYIMRT
jgi:microcystin-dependent protein